MLAFSRKIGGSTKCQRLAEIQANLQNVGALQKYRRIYKMLAPYRKIGESGKSWRPAYCLGSAESQTADFLLDWLKSSRSDPRRYVASLSCRPQVRTQPRLPCFYGRSLSCTVPAACTGPTFQKIRGNQNYWRPRIFSPIPVKTPKSYLCS